MITKILNLILCLSVVLGFSTTVLAQCQKFDNYPHGAEEGKKVYFYFREHIKKKNYTAALPLWQDLYAHSPAGSEYQYTDGIKIFEHLIKKESDEATITVYQDTLFMLYDQRIVCFKKTGTKKGDILTRKGFAMYKQKMDNKSVFHTFKEGVMLADKKTGSFILNPFAKTTIEAYKAENISKIEAQEIHAKLLEIADYHVENGKNEKAIFKYSEAKENIERTFRQKLDNPIFDCEYYSKIYIPQYEANPDDVENYSRIYKALIKGKCEKTMPLLVEIYTKDSIRLKEEKAQALLDYKQNAPKSKKAFWVYQEGDFETSAQYFIEAAAEEDALSTEQKADMCFKAAQIAFSNLKDFPKAREYAQKALEYRPNWGKPYLLIGDLYASSGSLCGTGTGFKSQVVTWVAIDMWTKAKQVSDDPAVITKATKQIQKYTRFMPTKGDLHSRNLKEGSSFTVPCWIQKRTTIRAYSEY
jgi:tetratricopeptide (TPR) repeat protein